MIKSKYRLKNILLFTIGFTVLTTIDCKALTVEPITVPGVDEAFYDSEVPPALKVKSASKGQFPENTVLYRHVHEGVDYYSPVVPESLRHLISGSYNDWGPWDMAENKETSGYNAITYHHKEGKINVSGGAKVYSDNGGSGTSYAGTIANGTKITILGIYKNKDKEEDTEYVYFNMGKFYDKGLSKVGSTNIGRVKKGEVDLTISSKMDIYYSDKYYGNFKKAAKYTNNVKTNFEGLSAEGRFKNSNDENLPVSIRGKKGEWRYLGYNAHGAPLDNPYFIADAVGFHSADSFATYPFRYTPWNGGDAIENEYLPWTAYEKFQKTGESKYDKAPYLGLKRDALERLADEGHIKYSQIDDLMNRLSLRTHPTKQATVWWGQKRDEVRYRTGLLLLEENIRDLYMKQILVTDAISGSTVVNWTCGINGGCSMKEGSIYAGRPYNVKIVIGNGADSMLLKDTLESEVYYNYTYTNGSSGSRNERIRMGNKGGMYKTVNSPSNPFLDRIYADTNARNIVINAKVGSSHAGVDNNIYTNDEGSVKLNVIKSGGGCSVESSTTMVCGQGDIVPYNIQIFDEAGNQVYRHMYNKTTPEIKEAIVPGKKYQIVYNSVYKGEDIIEYKWVPRTDDNPSSSSNNYVAGEWVAKDKVFNIYSNFHVVKYSGKPNQEDITTVNRKWYKYEDYGTPNYGKLITNDIVLKNGKYLTYKEPYVMFQHPYLLAAFRTTTSGIMNTDTTNDRMEIIINDEFDISVDSLRVKPSNTFVESVNDKIDYNITYNASLTIPSYVTKEDYQASINTAIEINGKTYYVKDQLLKGSNNENITHVIKNVPISSLGNQSVKVYLNYDSNSYENGGHTNNKAETTINATKVFDPISGSPNDTVKTPDSLNSNNSNKGGNANNNCLTPRTRNAWSSTHRKFSWNSNKITYQTSSTGADISFNKYYTTYDNANELTETYEENFGITKILFKSKETVDKKYGSNGWVNLLSSDEEERKKAIIKAGYGFELKIVTRYSTDAFSKREWNISNNGSSGTAISNLNSTAEYGLEDIFLELPGTTSTRKILSSTGYGSTITGLNKSKKVTGDTVEWTYTIKAANTISGAGATNKIYIPSETKDGNYKLKIYTPPVTGVGSPNKETYSALCDRKEVTIEVKGSAMNDLNSHETQ